jgi:signal transduction histidine kinase
MSHEIRTLMNAIIGMFIRPPDRLDPKQRDYAENPQRGHGASASSTTY